MPPSLQSNLEHFYPPPPKKPHAHWQSLAISSRLLQLLPPPSHFSRVRPCAALWMQPDGFLCPWDSPARRVLESAAMLSSRGSSRPRDQTQVFCTAGRFFTAEPPGKPHNSSPRRTIIDLLY